MMMMMMMKIELYLQWPTNRKSHYGLSNGAIFNDLERLQTQILISRSGHSLTLNISKMATDTAIVTMESEQETVPKLSNGTTFNNLE